MHGLAASIRTLAYDAEATEDAKRCAMDFLMAHYDEDRVQDAMLAFVYDNDRFPAAPQSDKAAAKMWKDATKGGVHIGYGPSFDDSRQTTAPGPTILGDLISREESGLDALVSEQNRDVRREDMRRGRTRRLHTLWAEAKRRLLHDYIDEMSQGRRVAGVARLKRLPQLALWVEGGEGGEAGLDAMVTEALAPGATVRQRSKMRQKLLTERREAVLDAMVTEALAPDATVRERSKMRGKLRKAMRRAREDVEEELMKEIEKLARNPSTHDMVEWLLGQDDLFTASVLLVAAWENDLLKQTDGSSCDEDFLSLTRTEPSEKQKRLAWRLMMFDITTRTSTREGDPNPVTGLRLRAHRKTKSSHDTSSELPPDAREEICRTLHAVVSARSVADTREGSNV